MLHRQLIKTEEIKAKTSELLQSYNLDNQAMLNQEQEPQFIFLPTREALEIETNKALNSTHHSIVSTATWDLLSYYFEAYFESMQKALERGVTIRTISNKPKGQDKWPKLAQELMKFPSYQIRSVDHFSALFWIKDGKELTTLTVHPSTLKPTSVWLWSSCSPFVRLAQEYFELLWDKAN
jgi:hypothetical protein